MLTNDDALQLILEAEGCEDLSDFISNRGYDSVVPGICKECEALEEVEPDCENEECPVCGEEALSSILVLAELL